MAILGSTPWALQQRKALSARTRFEIQVQYVRMQDLGKLFGSPARVRILRLFTFNPDAVWDRDEVARRTRVAPESTSRELALLARAGFLKRKSYFKEVARPRAGTSKKRRAIGWALDQTYPYLAPLETFLAETVSVTHGDIRARLRGVGTVRLLVLSGIFTGAQDSLLDLMLVGDRLNDAALSTALRHLEAELGREVRYAVLGTDDFLLRRRVRDKLVRDVLDYPHEALIDKLVG